MPSTDATLAPAVVAHNAIDGGKPVLFLHIPKTAGTSFLLMLQNTFGDNRVRRIQTVDASVQSTINTAVEGELEQISCLTGHLPIHLFDDCLDRFRPFTVLRDPIDRVLSLYRFLRVNHPDDLKRLGLREDFSLSEFLGSSHPELYGQVHNGMLRMLCGDARLSDPKCAEFWATETDIGFLHGAIANLDRMDFGLTEMMDMTLELAQACWSVPYELQQYHENTTAPDRSLPSAAAIHQIISMNTHDLAMYHWARSTFAKRMRVLQVMPNVAWDLQTIFVPVVDRSVSVANIPGRRGFHEFERIGFAWLHADQVADIHFAAAAVVVRLRLHVYSITPDYPIEDLVFRMNGQPLRFGCSSVDGKWRWIETSYFKTCNGINCLAITQPLSMAASALDPQTEDRRRLGIGLAHVVLVH